MPLFCLTPVRGALDRPAWAGSTHRGRCYVAARNARHARLYAANRFTDPAAARTASGMLPASPWTQPGLVALALAVPLEQGEALDGTILVPEDPRDPHGGLRVLAGREAGGGSGAGCGRVAEPGARDG